MWKELILSAILFVAVDCQGVGFNAVLPVASLVLTGETIVFNHTTTNMGGLYSISSGVFSCPSSIPAVYLFQLSVKAQALNYAEAQIVFYDAFNNTDIPVATVEAADSYDSATIEAFIECGLTSGDTVRVVGLFGELYSEEGLYENSFSGVLHRLLI